MFRLQNYDVIDKKTKFLMKMSNLIQVLSVFYANVSEVQIPDVQTPPGRL